MNAIVRELRRPEREAGVYLGPASVNAVSAHEVTVSLTTGEIARAELALALPYAPAVGDVLLVIGANGKHYAIGVVRGTGQMDLSFHGNVQLRSLSGKVSL